jgi:cation-transporting ATPase E
VGADAYANAFADEAKRFSLVGSELRDSINRVLTWVGWAIGPIGLLVLNAQMQVAGGWRAAWESGSWVQAVVNTIASLTAMIPLGLVLMTSITFAVGAARLAARQVLVNELPAVEGLARVDVICLDKTGTLTEGEIAYDDAHLLDEVAGWRRTLGWYGNTPDANATARTLREPFAPRRRTGRVSLGRASGSRPRASGAPWRSTTTAIRRARGCSARPRWCSAPPRPTSPTRSERP